MLELTISEAARRCGVHRRTLQRAIQRGRLQLTPAAHLTLEALQQAGYTAAAPQVTPQDLARMITLLETMAEDIHALRTRLVPRRTTVAALERPAPAAPQDAAPVPRVAMSRDTAAAPQDIPQRYTADTPQGTRRHMPQRHAADDAADDAAAAPQGGIEPPFDTAKYVLGKLCPRGHAWENTGQSLLRRTNRHCGACDREKFQERGQAR